MRGMITRGTIIAVAAGGILGMVAVAAAEGRLVRKPVERVLIPWGQSEESLGLLRGEEMERCGPLGFCVDGAGVQILDTVNARVVSTGPGRVVQTTAKDVRATAVAPDGRGGIFVLEGRRIQRYHGGRQEESFDLPAKSGFVEGYGADIAVSSRGVHAGSADQKTWTVATRNASGQFSPNQGPAAARAARGRPGTTTDSLTFEIKRMSGNQVRVLGTDPGGKIRLTVTLQMDGDPPGAVLFKGQDAAGNLYVEVERLRGGRAGLEVHRYSPNGTRLAVFELDNDYYTTVYTKTCVACDGTVWQLLTTPDGVRILRF